MIQRGGEKGEECLLWTRQERTSDVASRGVLDGEGKEGHALGFIDRTKRTKNKTMTVWVAHNTMEILGGR